MILKTAENGEDFQKNAKQYVVNMLSNARTLHKKNGCYYARYLTKYYDFETLKDAEGSGIECLKCKKCFKEHCREVAK